MSIKMLNHQNLPKKIVCLHCFNLTETGRFHCNHCGAHLRPSRKFYQLISDGKYNIFPSKNYLAKFTNLSESTVEKAMKAYGFDFIDIKSKVNKIRCIKVRGLFDYLDYDISLNNDISILIAPNGYGKTTIFNIVNFMLNPTPDKFNFICLLPFKKVEIKFDEKSIIMKNDINKENIEFSVSGVNKAVSIPKKAHEDNESDNSISLTIESALKKLLNFYLESGICVSIDFVETNRVVERIQKDDFETRPLYVRSDSSTIYNPIVDCNNNLIEQIQSVQDKYRKLVEKTRDSLPEKFLSQKIKKSISYIEFRKKWDMYYKYLTHLTNFGLVESQNDKNYINDIDEIKYNKLIKEKGNFLTVYLEEYQKTLEPFRELDQKLTFFKKIIDSHKYNEKTLYYSKNGFGFKRGNINIDLDLLSSGEKNDIVMFYNLIFKTKNNSIILIDEPEISLHIIWQLNFINGLRQALQDKNCQVLISTHSPEIIGKNERFLANIKNK